ncbi:hypothetical protein B9Z55_002960 [Caenorhabditis nigoni]|uniref:Domain of unknown function WSN domain-containing protein n=1 Tax=Caenorhabditis nigoni TaxID=1611254 RepID=A0A2G5VN97_9PELO|nr:hypothetical protein B9Z55_002960 [Caenorhabditis nigoni]
MPNDWWNRRHYALVLAILGIALIGNGVDGKHLEDFMPRGSSENLWNSEANIRSKRATNSNLHQVTETLAPFARLTYALNLQAALFDSDSTINDFADRFLDLEPSSIDSLLSFDLDFSNKIRKSLEGSSIQELVEVFRKLENSLSNLKQKPLELPQRTLIGIQNILDVRADFQNFPTPNQLLESFKKFNNTLFEDLNFGSTRKNFQKTIINFLSLAKKSRRSLQKMGTLKISADLKAQLEDRSKWISKIFPKDLSSIFPMKTAERIGSVLKEQRISNNVRVFENLKFLEMQDQTNDLELLRRDLLNGSVIKGSLSNPESMKKLENDLKPILALEGSLHKFKLFIYKSSTNFQVLLEPLERLQYVGSHEEYNKTLKWLEETYSKWQTGFNLVNDFYLGMAGKVDNAEKLFDGKNLNFKSIETWLETFGTAKMDEFENGLNNINSNDALNTFKNDNDVFKSVGNLVSVSTELQKFKAAHEALLDLENLNGRVQDAETNLGNFVEEFMEHCKDEKIEKMKLLAETVLKLLEDDVQKALKKFNTDLKSHLETLQKSVTQIQEKKKKPQLVENWETWSKRVQTSNQLKFGFLNFNAFEKSLKRKTDVFEFIQKYTDFVNDVYQNPKDKFRENLARKILKVPRSQKYVEEMFKDIEKLEKQLEGNVSMATLDSILKEAESVRNPEISGQRILRELALAKSLELTENFKLDQAYGALEKVEDLDLDFVSLQSANLTDFQSFLNEELAKPLIIVPDDFYSQPWIFIFMVILILIIIWTFLCLGFWRGEREKPEKEEKKNKFFKKLGKNKKDVIKDNRKPDAVALQKEEEKEFKEGKTNADPNNTAFRAEFRNLLDTSGTNIRTTIHKIAEGIQQAYIQQRGVEKSKEEKMNYRRNSIGSIESPFGGFWAIMHSELTSKDIWDNLRKANVKGVINLKTSFDGDHQTEFLHNIREDNRDLYSGKETDQPHRNLKLLSVNHESGYKFDYWKYEEIPFGYAPPELTPVQLMYNWASGRKTESGELIKIGCMDSRADTRACLFPLIDTILYIMTTSETLQDLHQAGKWMALQRIQSVDLVTTTQIEFALYVCFKIIAEEAQTSESEFSIKLENAWILTWKENLKQYREFFDASVTPREEWWPATKQKLVDQEKEVSKMMEARREQEKKSGHPDPFAV